MPIVLSSWEKRRSMIAAVDNKKQPTKLVFHPRENYSIIPNDWGTGYPKRPKSLKMLDKRLKDWHCTTEWEKLCQPLAVRSYWKTIMATCFSCHKDISMKRKNYVLYIVLGPDSEYICT